jgi:hypothetical protein
MDGLVFSRQQPTAGLTYDLDYPTGKDTDNAALEKRLWDAVDLFRALREKVSRMIELLNVFLQKEDVLRRRRDLLLPHLLSRQDELSATNNKE